MITDKLPLPPLEDLKEAWAYDPETGIFTYARDKKGCRRGAQVCANNTRRYLQARFRTQTYTMHRVAWLYITGDDPGDLEIDHINGDTHDNRAENLRLATRQQNMKNTKLRRHNALQAKGVHKKKGRFIASISCDGRRYNLGYFDTLAEANIAYRAAATVAHGIFQRVD